MNRKIICFCENKERFLFEILFLATTRIFDFPSKIAINISKNENRKKFK